MSVIKRMEIKNGVFEVITMNGTQYVLKNIEGGKKYRVFLKSTNIGEVETMQEVVDLINNVEKFREI